MGKLNWVEMRDTIISKAVEMKKLTGEPPTLRALHYFLVSKSLIPNTKSAYTTLSDRISNWRYDGSYPWDLLKDETRTSLFYQTDSLRDILNKSNNINLDLLQGLEHTLENVYQNRAPYYNYDNWEGQPKRVFICLEKQALLDYVKKVSERFETPIFCTRGYSSTTQIKEIADEIMGIDAQPVILMLGDFDPTGIDIIRNLREKLQDTFNIDCIVEKIGVTLDQIKEHNLPNKPEDEKEIQKMRRDTRFKNWEYGLFRVELDALLAYAPEQFKEIIQSSIMKYFDMNIYENLKTEIHNAQDNAKNNLLEIREELKPTYDQIKQMIETLSYGY